jgi:parallel beta-helix repeat protein
MDRKRASVIIVFILFAGLLHFTIVILPERARAITLYVGGSGPGNYTTIQDAIDTANPGDRVFVYNGLYYENIIVDKTVELEGEDWDATAINGSLNIDTVLITADWVNVTGFNITYSSVAFAGIKLEYVSNCSIERNTVSHNGDGISLQRSSHNFVDNNTLHSNHYSDVVLSFSDFNIISNNTASSDNWSAVALFSSKGSVVKDNTMENNGIYVYGESLEYWNTHTIDFSNTVNGKPIRYLKNATGMTVPAGAGQVIVANSTLVTIKDQNLSNIVRGIQVAYSSNNIIDNNAIGFCRTDGIFV